MKIALISPSFGNAFGQERVISKTTELLRGNGHEVLWVGSHWLGGAKPKHVVIVSGLSDVHLAKNTLGAHQIHRQALSFINSFQPDVVHLADQFDFRFLRSLSKKYPTVLTSHTVAPTCPASHRFTKLGVCHAKSGWNCLALTRRYGCLDFLKNDLHRIHLLLNYQLRRKALRYKTHVIAVSRFVAGELVRDGYPKERVHLVYNPVSVEEGTETTHEVPPHCFVIASRLVPLKGILEALDGFKIIENKPWALWICGEGVLKNSIENKIRDLGLEGRIRMLGKVPYSELQSILRRSCCLIQPNVGPEAFGLAAAEAGLLGIPIIASDIPALNEIVLHGENGLLVPPRSPRALAFAICKILEDTEFSLRIRERAPTLISERYSDDGHLRATLDCYQACIRNYRA